MGNTRLFYKDKPIFGFDIGRSTIKLMQINQTGKKTKVVGYGIASFPASAIKNGVIVSPEAVIKAAHGLINGGELLGKLTTRRAAVSLPNALCFSRVLQLPIMTPKDIEAAVLLELEHSTPFPTSELYYDFSVTRVLDDKTQEVQVLACPKAIVDSYQIVFDALGLTVSLAESNIAAVTRVVVRAEEHDAVTLIIDFGSIACDLAVYNENATNITGTVDCSSETITSLIAEKLGISNEQAYGIKTRYGLEKSKKQEEIASAIEPELSKLINEIKKVMRYHAEHSGSEAQIEQIIILGGGANLPGLSSYITSHTRIPTRLCAPWDNLEFGQIRPPRDTETTLYTTAGGLGLITKSEIAA